MTKRLSVAVVTLALLGAACSSDGDKPSVDKAASRSGAPQINLSSGVPSGLKVGLVVSSSGPGVDVRDLAAGAYVAAFRLNGARSGTEHVELMVADDNGTAEGATGAIKSLHEKGVIGVVYASTGDHVLAGAAAAGELGVPVVFPYADDSRIPAQGTTSFLAGPTSDQVADRLAKHARESNLSKVVLVRQAGSYGEAGRVGLSGSGLSFAAEHVFNPGDVLADMAKAVVTGKPDAVIVWAEAGPAVAVADALAVAGVSAPLLLGARAAVPAFGHAVASALAPSVADGVLSAGEWIVSGTPTGAVDAFFLAREQAVSEGAVSADLSRADFSAHDAVLALVAAARAARSDSSGAVLDELRKIDTSSVDGAAGVAMHFDDSPVVANTDVALLTYSTIDDGRGRYPAVAAAGGHWEPVTGTFSPPEALKGLDDPYGG